MLGLADGTIPSQPAFLTGQALFLCIFQIKIGIRLVIAFISVMGAQCWVPLPLFRPSAAPFLAAVGLLLEILFFVR